MDDGSNRNRPAGASGASGGSSRSSRDARDHPRPSRPAGNSGGHAGNEQGGGLLSRYNGAGNGGSSARRSPSAPRSGSRSGADAPPTSGDGLLSRARRGGDREKLRDAFTALGDQARRLGQNVRRAAGAMRNPQSGDWRASDFDQRTLDTWDRDERVPFEVPDEPDMSDARTRPASGDRRRQAPRDARGGGGPRGRGRPSAPRHWNDDEWDAGWETGTWDTGWATGLGPSVDYGRESGEDDDSGFWSPRRDGWGDDDGRGDPLAESLSTLARLGAVHAPMSRLARVRLLLRTRPAAAAMLAFFLLGFMLTCCAPVIPMLRLGYDASDALRRAQTLQGMLSDQSALLNASTLKDAQAQVDGITHDLYEINSAINIVGAPLSAVSSTARNYRLLTRIGFDMTATASEGLQVAQTILTPLQGGALAADSSSPGLTMDDINQAKSVLADAQVRLADALAAYSQLDPSALKGPLAKFGKYLALLPEAPPIISEMQVLLNSAPSLLGIGQNAYYLVIAMDRSELRPAGGFMGNYGILTLTGGRQSAKYPLSLQDTYTLDGDYYKWVYSQAPAGTSCIAGGPQPPNYYWWWPYRQDTECKYDWGLRDSGLSADFPTNARNAEQIVLATPNKIPDNGTALQGVIAFTPVLIEDLMAVTGPVTMSDWKVTVTPQNLEGLIHHFQLTGNTNGPRKAFTHDLSTIMLAKIKGMHGAQLKQVFKIAQEALKSKDLEIYFNDPHAELILQQLGLAAQISTGNGDGFFVVDANDGGNKANSFVNEHQTDYVTLLPNGGALHRLQISVNYNKTGYVFDGTQAQEDYVDMQRTYLPGDASILGYSGFVPTNTFGTPACPSIPWAAMISDTTCSHVFAFTTPITASDVPGRTMVFGSLFISCGRSMDPTHTVETVQDFQDIGSYTGGGAVGYYDYFHGCFFNGPEIARTENIYIEWYTPHAFTIGADGHGTYTELVEKQAGSADFATGVGDYLTVYVDTSLLHGKSGFTGDPTITTEAQWDALIAGKKPLPQYNNMKLLEDTQVTFNF